MSNRKISPEHALEVAVRKLHAARKEGDRHDVRCAEKGLENARHALKCMNQTRGRKAHRSA